MKPVIDSVVPFAQIVEAHRRVDGGHKVGSVVVTLEPDGSSATSTSSWGGVGVQRAGPSKRGVDGRVADHAGRQGEREAVWNAEGLRTASRSL